MAILARCKWELDAASRTEVIRRALKLLDYALKGELVLRDSDGNEKVLEVL